jgi:hypothetical protein
VVSDIVLVLRSEHRDLIDLAQQCTRPSRGFEDPVGRLHGRLRAHMDAMERVATSTVRWIGKGVGPMGEVLDLLTRGTREPPDRQATPALAWAVVDHEEGSVIPQLEREVPLLERRRAGKSFRLVRATAMRSYHPSSRRVRSQAELYALARRAGVEQRSRMSQAQLQRAVEAWERRGDAYD